jgi:hypothetical protein
MSSAPSRVLSDAVRRTGPLKEQNVPHQSHAFAHVILLLLLLILLLHRFIGGKVQAAHDGSK